MPLTFGGYGAHSDPCTADGSNDLSLSSMQGLPKARIVGRWELQDLVHDSPRNSTQILRCSVDGWCHQAELYHCQDKRKSGTRWIGTNGRGGLRVASGVGRGLAVGESFRCRGDQAGPGCRVARMAGVRPLTISSVVSAVTAGRRSR